MAYRTIFAAPRPFTNPHIDIIQRNALQAWKSLPNAEVILIGDEPGLPRTAQEFGVRTARRSARSW